MNAKTTLTISPRRQLSAFMARYSPEVAAVARAAIAKMRARLPAAVQLVGDTYNALVVGFGPTERASDALFSIVLYPRWVTFFFLHGANLDDPRGRLKGNGRQVRHIVLTSAAVLEEPEVRALIRQALARAEDQSFERGTRSRIVIKSVSVRQRPRRPKQTVRKRDRS